MYLSSPDQPISRICPGRHLANVSLFLNVASVLHVFNVQPAINEDGEPLSVDVDPITGLVA